MWITLQWELQRFHVDLTNNIRKNAEMELGKSWKSLGNTFLLETQVVFSWRVEHEPMANRRHPNIKLPIQGWPNFHQQMDFDDKKWTDFDVKTWWTEWISQKIISNW